jgi:hypothetical protein
MTGWNEAMSKMLAALKWAATVIRPGSDLRADMDEAIRLGEEALTRPDSGWQPIDSAPKDGTCVLIDDNDPDCDPVVAFYQGGRWLVRWDHEEYGAPARWAPLPEPPSPREAK